MKSKLSAVIVLSCLASVAMGAEDTKAQAEIWLENFKKADLNSSGGLSKTELDKTKPNQFGSIKKRFDNMDVNKDGQVTAREYAEYTQKRHDAWLAAFKSADLNNSNGLSKSELDKTKPNQFGAIKKYFDSIDTNKDGQVTVAERDSFKPPKTTITPEWQAAFKKADLNDSSGLSKVELGQTSAQSFVDIKKDFDSMDSNKDGQVTAAEYQTYLDSGSEDEEDEDAGVLPLLKELFK